METDCPICLSSLVGSPIVTSGCCNHPFHTVCYTKCMISKLECPLCRASQSTVDDIRITVNPVIVPPRTILVSTPRTIFTNKYVNCVGLTSICLVILFFVSKVINLIDT